MDRRTFEQMEELNHIAKLRGMNVIDITEDEDKQIILDGVLRVVALNQRDSQFVNKTRGLYPNKTAFVVCRDMWQVKKCMRAFAEKLITDGFSITFRQADSMITFNEV